MGNLTHLCVLSLVILGLGGAAGDSDGQPTAEEVARARPNMQNLDAEADENMAALAANHTLVTKVYVVPTQSGGASGAAARRARLTSQLEAMGVLNITEWVDDANAITRHTDPEVSAAARAPDPHRYLRYSADEEAAEQRGMPFADRRALRVAPPLSEAQHSFALRYAEALRRAAKAGHEAALVLTDRVRLGKPAEQPELLPRIEKLAKSASMSGKAFVMSLSTGSHLWHLPITSALGWYVKVPPEAGTTAFGTEREAVPFQSYREDHTIRGPEALLVSYLASRVLWEELLPFAFPLASQLSAALYAHTVVTGMWAVPALATRADADDDDAVFDADEHGAALADAMADAGADADANGGSGLDAMEKLELQVQRDRAQERADKEADLEDGSAGDLDSAAPAAVLAALQGAAEAFPSHRAVKKAYDGHAQLGFAALEAGEAEAAQRYFAEASGRKAVRDSDAGLLSQLLLRRAGAGGFEPEAAWKRWRGADTPHRTTGVLSAVARSESLFFRCAKFGLPRLCGLLLDRHGGLDLLREAGEHQAAHYGEGAVPPTDIRFKEGLNGTALTLAARNGHMEVATLLLDAGANELVGDDGESTPLLHAVSHGRAAIVRTLSAKRAARQGAVLNELDKSGHTPLQRAAMAGHARVARALLRSGADANTPDKDGNTALMFAAYEGHASTVKALVAGGADPFANNTDGIVAAQFAQAGGSDEILRFFEQLYSARGSGAEAAPGAGAGPTSGSGPEAVTGQRFGVEEEAARTSFVAVIIAFGILLAVQKIRRRNTACRCRAQLEAIYKEHAPAMLSKLDEVTTAFAGQEELMVQKAIAKYVPKKPESEAIKKDEVEASENEPKKEK